MPKFISLLAFLMMIGCQRSVVECETLYSGKFKNGQEFAILYQTYEEGSYDGYPKLQIGDHVYESLQKQEGYDASYEGKFSHEIIDDDKILLRAQREGGKPCEYLVTGEEGVVSFKLLEE